MPGRAQPTHNRVQFVRSEVRPSTAIIETTAQFLGRDPLDLRPLETCIDPDALDALFDGKDGTPVDQPRDVRFEYHGIEVGVLFEDRGSFSVELSGRTE